MHQASIRFESEKYHASEWLNVIQITAQHGVYPGSELHYIAEIFFNKPPPVLWSYIAGFSDAFDSKARDPQHGRPDYSLYKRCAPISYFQPTHSQLTETIVKPVLAQSELSLSHARHDP